MQDPYAGRDMRVAAHMALRRKARGADSAAADWARQYDPSYPGYTGPDPQPEEKDGDDDDDA